MEEWTATVKEVLSETLSNQAQIQAKLTDLEACSCRNNIRMYGIPEDAEGGNLQEFMESFIKAELSLRDVDLGIQHCHRAQTTTECQPPLCGDLFFGVQNQRVSTPIHVEKGRNPP